MYQHSQHDLEDWVAKHNTAPELRWALLHATASINSLTKANGLEDPEELSLWRARLPLIKTKALLLGINLET